MLSLSACSELDLQTDNGYPKIALELGRVKNDCLLEQEEWLPILQSNNFETKRQHRAVFKAMRDHAQLVYLEKTNDVAISAKYCQK